MLAEFDLDGALARKPALILVDELAHSNVAGSRHPKRWQDVEELLAAGIDVWYDAQRPAPRKPERRRRRHHRHPRLGDGARPRLRRADEVVLVDLPPDDLLSA
jgi:two-component system sensor histidine kinase KdpD